MKKNFITISVIALSSILLWISVALSNDYVSTINVPIVFSELAKDYSINNKSARDVVLKIKGSGWSLLKANIAGSEEFVVSVHRQLGKHKDLTKDHLPFNRWLNNNFQVIEIEPANIEYEIARNIKKKVKVVLNWLPEFKPEYGFTSPIKVEPSYIDIIGPYDLLKDIDSVKTYYEQFTDISENFSAELSFEEIEGVRFATTKCSVSFEVQKIVDKTFDEIAVDARNVPYMKELDFFPSKISVVLRGGINKLGKLTKDSLSAYVDYWGALKETEGEIVPTIKIPNQTTIVNIIPNKLEYIIKQK